MLNRVVSYFSGGTVSNLPWESEPEQKLGHDSILATIYIEFFFFPNKFLLLILQLGNTDNFSVTRCFFAWCPRLFRLPTVSLGHLSLLVCTEKGPSLACKRKFGNAK